MPRPSLRPRFRPAPVEGLERRAVMAAPTFATELALPGAGNPWGSNGIDFVPGPLVADIDNNGRDELIVVGGDSNVYAYSFEANNALVPRRTYASGQATQFQAKPALAVLPDGRRAIFAAANNGQVFGWDANTGALLPGWPQSADARFGGSVQAQSAVYGAVTVADLDGDDNPEILVTSISHAVSAFRSDGRLFWQFNNDDTIVGAVAVGDLDRDGRPEVVFGGDLSQNDFYRAGGQLVALSYDGRRRWVKSTDQTISSAPVLADLNADGYLEVVVGTGFFFPGPNGTFLGNRVYAVDRNGVDVPGWPYVTAPPNVDGRVLNSPAVADVDGDGALDVVAVDNQSRIHAIRANGTPIFVAQGISSPQPFFGSPIVADVDGDGDQDVIVSNSLEVAAFDGRSGQRTFVDTRLGANYRGTPAVASLRGDASRQLVAVGSTAVNGNLAAPTTARVWNMDPTAARDAWPQSRLDVRNSAVVRADALSQDFIIRLYAGALGRQPSAQELAGWTAYYRSAPSFRMSIRGIVSSVEARIVRINEYYGRYLNRGPEPGGLQNWLGVLAAGRDDSFLEAAIVSSDEAYNNAGATPQGWVNDLYRLVLGRTPSAEESAGWVRTIQENPGARLSVAEGFLYSQELTENQVRAWYAQYRPGGQAAPTAEALAGAGWDLRRRRSDESVLTDLLDSNGDYLGSQVEGSWLRAMYRDALGREASPPELIGWLRTFESGIGLDTASRAIINSAEYYDRLVAGWYARFLGRGSSQGERLGLVNRMAGGLPSTEGLIEVFASQEYYNRAGGNNNAYLNRLFSDLIGRGPTSEQVQSLIGTPADQFRANAARFLLRTPEYAVNNIQTMFFHYLRRFSYTPADGSAVFRAGVDPNASIANEIAFMGGGGTLEQIQGSILAAPEYVNLARNKAFWNGTRWTIGPRPTTLPYQIPN